MNVNSPVGPLLDEICELVGVKAGLAITPADVARLLNQAEIDGHTAPEWITLPKNHWLRIRAEEIELIVLHLMYLIGALPTPYNRLELLYDFTYRHPEWLANTPDLTDEDDFTRGAPPFTRFVWFIEEQARNGLTRQELSSLVADWDRRTILDVMSRTSRRAWDGAASLHRLFEMPDVGGRIEASAESGTLLDQRFIDYLQAQPRDISRMHWRQFELLVGEFFRRSGYSIRITPPTGDGGIDVHALRDVAIPGPELILIQAKRFGDHRQVGVESVKALWSDVDESHATRGIIATTSTLSHGARTFCQARHYRLTAAERGTVEAWLRSLATYPR